MDEFRDALTRHRWEHVAGFDYPKFASHSFEADPQPVIDAFRSLAERHRLTFGKTGDVQIRSRANAIVSFRANSDGGRRFFVELKALFEPPRKSHPE
ncbi:MAG TPA: hypothetical protein VJI13_06745 [Candidatus Norongarragalinales archaeon]|nr:hypothetical protein [Candidatus Norongarragalinales archaeon]